MKKSKILKLFSLAAFAMAGAFALASAKGSEKTEVKADYSGSVIIQKNDNDAKWDGCYLASYMFDDDSHSTWGPKVANTSAKYQVYEWSGLSFSPTKIIMLRVPSNWDSSWGNPWWDGEGGIYARTGNVTLSTTDVIWMAGNAKEGSDWGTYQVDAVVKGGASDSWSVATVDTKLSNYKINGAGNLEAYGSVSLPAGTYFKVVKTGSEWIGAYTAHSSIQGNLSGGGESNIHNTSAATYDFYFDYDAKTLYITDPVLAEADEWAQDFLSVNCQATMAQWSVQGARFNAMSSGAKSLLANQAHIDHDATPGSYVESAVQRYDFVIQVYGTAKYADFMGRVAAGKITSGSLTGIEMTINNTDSSNLVVIVSIVALISATSLVGLIVIKKRRSIAK